MNLFASKESGAPKTQAELLFAAAQRKERARTCSMQPRGQSGRRSVPPEASAEGAFPACGFCTPPCHVAACANERAAEASELPILGPRAARKQGVQSWH